MPILSTRCPRRQVHHHCSATPWCTHWQYWQASPTPSRHIYSTSRSNRSLTPVRISLLLHSPSLRLTRELEKKFSDRHVIFVGQRRILGKPGRRSRVKQPRPRSRTLTAVHDSILEDLAYPSEIVGKRTRVAQDGSKQLRVFLDARDETNLGHRTQSLSDVYRKLTGHEVVFGFRDADGI